MDDGVMRFIEPQAAANITRKRERAVSLRGIVVSSWRVEEQPAGQGAVPHFIQKFTVPEKRAVLPFDPGPKMPLLSIKLFGEFSVSDHRGNTLAIGNRRTQGLIAWLALHLTEVTPLRDFAA